MHIINPIKRQKTLTEQAADAIRARIIEGQFEFGEALSEITLAAEMGVSKTPVREAFLQLKNEGLVEILPQRGTFVFRMTIEELRQLFDMREILESSALRFAMRDNCAELSSGLKRIIKEAREAVEARDTSRFRNLDAEFHGEIITRSGNAFVQSAYNIIALRIHAFRNRLPVDVQTWDTFDMHSEIARLVAAKDVEGAIAALRAHIKKSFTDYMTRNSNGEADVA